MLWLDRVNGNGRPFRQWHATRTWETPPEWPSAASPGCPVCGEQYEQRYMEIDGTWKEGKRDAIYHEPQMHKEYRRDAVDATVELAVPAEPGHD